VVSPTVALPRPLPPLGNPSDLSGFVHPWIFPLRRFFALFTHDNQNNTTPPKKTNFGVLSSLTARFFWEFQEGALPPLLTIFCEVSPSVPRRGF